jgi:glycosyltransferase involved in cell wall biosynthesis
MRVCYFDDLVSGHHPSFIGGLAQASLEEGLGVIIASPSVPEIPDTGWIPLPDGHGARLLGGRKSLKNVARACVDREVDTLVDLNLDRNVWLLPKTLDLIGRHAHVLHHANQYTFEGRTAAGRGRTVILRALLRRLADHGAQIIVHTSRAFELLETVIPPSSILKLGYPVRRIANGEDSLRADEGIGRPRMLFVGRARHEKDLARLLAAVSRLPDPLVVRIVGRQDQHVRRELERENATLPIEWVDRYVTDSELSAEYHAASLVAVPYRSSFGMHGGASGVLLQTLAYGKPAITTSALEDQLPNDYKGAVVVPAEDTQALTEGIRHAMETLSDMSNEASVAGPEFIERSHSFRAYVTTLFGRESDND